MPVEMFPPLTGSDVTIEKCEARLAAINKYCRERPENFWHLKPHRELADSQLRRLRAERAAKVPAVFRMGWPLWMLLALAIFLALARN